jgi:hypothetical protein
MQSDNRTVTASYRQRSTKTKTQFKGQQKPESSGLRHQSPWIDGKSLEELLGGRHTSWKLIYEL